MVDDGSRDAAQGSGSDDGASPPKDRPSVIRETDADARRQARVLLRGARYGALAAIDPDNGFPAVSRVLVGSDLDGAAVILVSGLSAHTRALAADPRASLLVGEPGKGDPLAYPRLSVQCRAEAVGRDDPAHANLRRRFVARHPKSELYIDFPDFQFFRLVPLAASLNGGFGRAFLLEAQDFTIAATGLLKFAGQEFAILQELTGQIPQAADRVAYGRCGAKSGKWQFCGADCAGLDLICADQLLRYEFETEMHTIEKLAADMSKTEYPIPQF